MIQSICRKYFVWIAASAALLSAPSCKEDLGGSSWDVDVLAPIVTTRLSMANLIEDSIMVADADGLVRLKFETDLIGFQIDSLFRMPDTTIKTLVNFPGAITNLEPGSEFLPFIGRTRYELGGIVLKKVRLRQGTLKVKLKSVLPTPVEFNYEMPLSYLWGNPFEFFSTIEAGSISDTATAEFEFDLANYEMDLRSSSLTSFNTLESRYTLRTAANGQTVSVPAGQTFFILEYSFLNIVPDYGIGYFGQQGETVSEQVNDIDILSLITQGQILLDSVTIDLTVDNGVGADALFRLGHLISVNSRTGSSVALQHALVGSSVPLTRAVDLDGTAIGLHTTPLIYRMDNSNSNIKSVLENLPDKLDFSFRFDLNPLGNVSSGNDFFYYDRPFVAKMAVNVPLRASFQNLTLMDTVAFDLANNAVVESVRSGMFTLVAKNGFPMQANIEMVLLDELFQITDTLVHQIEVTAPTLDIDNKVVAPLESRVQIPLPAALAQRLHLAKHAQIKVRFNSPLQPQLISIYAHYAIDIKLIGDLNINFSTSEN